MNATIGFVLFEGYSQTEAFLLRRYYPSIPVPLGPFDSSTSTSTPEERSKPNFSPLWIVTAAGGFAGAAQCIISAPLDNVRMVLQTPPPSKSKTKGRFKAGDSTKSSPSLNFSWRAIARAAILPFAPTDNSRQKLVDKIKASQQKDPNTNLLRSVWKWSKGEKKEKEKVKEQLSNQERRVLWEKKLKRWRGGIHGAGLVFSLMRDSFGFAR